VGNVAPAYCTGVGKAMLAFMPPEPLQLALSQQAFHAYTPSTHKSVKSLQAELAQVRLEGVAFDREEHQQGIISMAAPILSANDRVLGALSVATSTAHKSLADLETLKPALLRIAKQIGQEAQFWQPPT
jgi:DNA-binding IclR family transcriptional regulator